MRRALAILFICLVSYQYMLKLGIVAWYEYHKDYIAGHLCQNRDKPQMKCCGKCYLHKQLAKADPGSRAGKPVSTLLSRIEMSPCLLPESMALIRCFEAHEKPYFHYSSPSLPQVTLSVFHPPG